MPLFHGQSQSQGPSLKEALLGRVHHFVVDAIEDSRDGGHDGRLEFLHVFDQQFDIATEETDSATHLKHGRVKETFEHVRQWKERKERVGHFWYDVLEWDDRSPEKETRLSGIRKKRKGYLRIGDDIGVREHDSFRISRRPARVRDCRERVWSRWGWRRRRFAWIPSFLDQVLELDDGHFQIGCLLDQRISSFLDQDQDDQRGTRFILGQRVASPFWSSRFLQFLWVSLERSRFRLFGYSRLLEADQVKLKPLGAICPSTYNSDHLDKIVNLKNVKTSS